MSWSVKSGRSTIAMTRKLTASGFVPLSPSFLCSVLETATNAVCCVLFHAVKLPSDDKKSLACKR